MSPYEEEEQAKAKAAHLQAQKQEAETVVAIQEQLNAKQLARIQEERQMWLGYECSIGLLRVFQLAIGAVIWVLAFWACCLAWREVFR